MVMENEVLRETEEPEKEEVTGGWIKRP